MVLPYLEALVGVQLELASPLVPFDQFLREVHLRVSLLQGLILTHRADGRVVDRDLMVRRFFLVALDSCVVIFETVFFALHVRGSVPLPPYDALFTNLVPVRVLGSL